MKRILKRKIPFLLINLLNKIKKNQHKIISLICSTSKRLVLERIIAMLLKNQLKNKANNQTFSVALNKTLIQTATKIMIHTHNNNSKWIQILRYLNIMKSPPKKVQRKMKKNKTKNLQMININRLDIMLEWIKQFDFIIFEFVFIMCICRIPFHKTK